MSKLANWIPRLEKARETARALEARGIELNLPDGFEVRENWPGLDWCEWGSEHAEKGSLPRFREMVSAVTAAIGGPPDKVGAESFISSGENVPDLVARWTIGGTPLTVRVLMPKGCKVDPRAPGITGKNAELHPECVAALDEIRELVLDIPADKAIKGAK